MITPKTIPAVRPDAIGQRMDDEAVIVTPASGTVKVLNDVGARVWELADGRRTVADLAALLCAEYDVELIQVQADVQAFVAEMVDRGIFTVESR